MIPLVTFYSFCSWRVFSTYMFSWLIKYLLLFTQLYLLIAQVCFGKTQNILLYIVLLLNYINLELWLLGNEANLKTLMYDLWDDYYLAFMSVRIVHSVCIHQQI